MISLNYRDSRPIYEQVKTGLRALVVSGAIGPDEKLPSVRELASHLAINPNTIARAYRELEQEDCIYTVSGKGTFANPRYDAGTRRKTELGAEFDRVAAELLFLGLTPDELCGRVRNLAPEEEQNK